jgi:peptide/nickel transport system ATP-binding protein/oligopeptide transport system ATP-binding protein
MNNMDFLTLKDVKKYYRLKSSPVKSESPRIKAVDGVNINVKKGGTVGIVGESGCGKSTIAKLILKLEKVSSGQIIFKGSDISLLKKKKLKEFREQVQMIFQNPFSSLNPKIPVGIQIKEVITIHRTKNKAAREKIIEELLSHIGLTKECLSRYPHELSGGQIQRINIARALAVNPELLICDEPVSALDVSIQSQIVDLLLKLQSNHHLTYLLISHNLNIVKYLTTEVFVMYLGKICESGETSQLFQNPQHPYTKALVNASRYQIDKGSLLITNNEIPSAIDIPTGCRFKTRCPEYFEKCDQEPPLIQLDKNRHAACWRI